MCEQYNGWTNRETWAAKLHIDNDQWLNDNAWSIARKWEEASQERSTYDLGQDLKNWVEDDLLTFDSITQANSDGAYLFIMLTDIGSLYRVNWLEIAQTYAEELAQEEANA